MYPPIDDYYGVCVRVRVRVCAWTPGIGLGLGQHLKLSTIPAKHLSRTHTRTYTPLHVLSRSDAHTHTPVRCIPYTRSVRASVCLTLTLEHTVTYSEMFSARSHFYILSLGCCYTCLSAHSLHPHCKQLLTGGCVFTNLRHWVALARVFPFCTT